MSKQPPPYTFPLKSRAAIAAFLNRPARGYVGGLYRFCWNVKCYSARFDSDTLRQINPDFRKKHDSQWDTFLAEMDPFWVWCEDAARYLLEGDWTSYPGNDQGEWEFELEGRSGGWLVLTKWRGRTVNNLTAEDFLDPEQWPWSDLVAFYRGIVCADVDFTPEKASREVEFHAALQRETEEADWREQDERRLAAEAEAMANARPDLAPCYA
jgi:hypothetical protein